MEVTLNLNFSRYQLARNTAYNIDNKRRLSLCSQYLHISCSYETFELTFHFWGSTTSLLHMFILLPTQLVPNTLSSWYLVVHSNTNQISQAGWFKSSLSIWRATALLVQVLWRIWVKLISDIATQYPLSLVLSLKQLRLLITRCSSLILQPSIICHWYLQPSSRCNCGIFGVDELATCH